MKRPARRRAAHTARAPQRPAAGPAAPMTAGQAHRLARHIQNSGRYHACCILVHPGCLVVRAYPLTEGGWIELACAAEWRALQQEVSDAPH